MAKEKIQFEHVVPEGGVSLDLPEDKALSEIKLSQIEGGITLAVVGSASGVGNRQQVRLAPIENGITLSIVGSASGPAR